MILSSGTASASLELELELEIAGERKRLQFSSTEDRAFSVGSSPHADVRVRRKDVPPIAFYLERRSSALWIVPAYRRSSLRVDSAPVTAPYRLGRAAVIEFSRVRARLMRSDEPALRNSDSAVAQSGAREGRSTALSESTRRSRFDYLAALPDTDDRTVVDPEPEHAASDPAESHDVVARARRSSVPGQRLCIPISERREVPPLPRLAPPLRAVPAPLPRLAPPLRAVPAPRVLAPARVVAPPRLPPKPAVPHLWSTLEQRPFEAAVFVLLIGVLIVAAAAGTAAFLRFH